jgi:hypothetical protein
LIHFSIVALTHSHLGISIITENGNRKLDWNWVLTPSPTLSPTPAPTANPTASPTAAPTGTPTVSPTAVPTGTPTAAPTPGPTLQPSMATPSPTGTPTEPVTMSPTLCKESYLTSENLNIALVVDLSYSTFEKQFSSEVDVGDVNGDGGENTILDAQVLAIQDLLLEIAASGTLNNENCEIELISFHTEATDHGVWPPLSANGTTYNEELMNKIKNDLWAPTSTMEIFNTNNGYTNFDAALDAAVEYFTNVATHDRKNLMVFLSDGEPNVRGDGDNEMFCNATTTFWGDGPDSDITYDCADVGDMVGVDFQAGDAHNFCLADDPDCIAKEQLQDCVRGPNLCLNAAATTQYDSELAALDALEVERIAIGVGDETNVTQGSALWMIDNNPGKDMGVLPLQALTLEELTEYLSSLCILTTDPPTAAPSDAPSVSPTKAPTASPSESPTGAPSTSPTISPTAHPTFNPTGEPTNEPTPVPTTEPTAAPTGEPTAAPTPGPTNSPTAAPTPLPTTASPTFILPECYDGPEMVVKDSSDITMCEYHDNMIEIVDMSTEQVMIKVNDVWANPDPNPEMMRIFVHNNGIDSILQQNAGDGFQCLNDDGYNAVIGDEEPLAVQCFQASEDNQDLWLAVIDVVITDEIICATNDVPHPCDPDGEPILESCSWRIVIPCEQAAVCTEEPTPSPTASPTGNPTEGDDDDIFLTPCPDDLLVLKHIGTKEYPNDAVTIVSQDQETVTVKINQAYSETEVSHFYYQYQEDHFDNKCYEEQDWALDESVEITIQCTHSTEIALLELWVADPTFTSGEDDATIPKCCHPTVPEDVPVTKYLLEIKCVSECPTFAQ